MRLTKTLHYAILVAMITVFMSLGFGASSVDDTDSADMDVSVNSKTIISITPNAATFSGNPGENTTKWTNFSVENDGSTTITDVWANVTHPSTDPFGTGDTSKYDSANMIALTNTSGGTTHFVDRKEFNQTVPSYVTFASNCGGTNGSIKFAHKEFFWCGNVTSGHDRLVIGNTPRTGSQAGTVDLSDGSSTTTYTSMSTEDGYYVVDHSFTLGSVTETYCVMLDQDGTHLRVVKWNQDVAATNCANNDGGLNDASMDPGGEINLELQARIPFGTTSGNLATGTLMIIAGTV